MYISSNALLPVLQLLHMHGIPSYQIYLLVTEIYSCYLHSLDLWNIRHLVGYFYNPYNHVGTSVMSYQLADKIQAIRKLFQPWLVDVT